MLDFSQLPVWVTVVKRVVTLLVLAALGVHAYVQYTRRAGKVPASERWVFFVFSVAFLFGVVANFAAAILATKLERKQGPFNFGSFSLLIFFLYLIFAAGVARRTRY